MYGEQACRQEGSIRDIAKALDFEKDEIDEMTKPLPENLLEICERTTAYPRYLSVHLGGVASMSKQQMTDLVPLQKSANGVIVTQFDKDDIEALGIIKMDVLGLRMLSAIQGTVEMLTRDGIKVNLDSIPLDDDQAYRMLRSCWPIGVFQLESTACASCSDGCSRPISEI